MQVGLVQNGIARTTVVREKGVKVVFIPLIGFSYLVIDILDRPGSGRVQCWWGEAQCRQLRKLQPVHPEHDAQVRHVTPLLQMLKVLRSTFINGLLSGPAADLS